MLGCLGNSDVMPGEKQSLGKLWLAYKTLGIELR